MQHASLVDNPNQCFDPPKAPHYIAADLCKCKPLCEALPSGIFAYQLEEDVCSLLILSVVSAVREVKSHNEIHGVHGVQARAQLVAATGTRLQSQTLQHITWTPKLFRCRQARMAAARQQGARVPHLRKHVIPSAATGRTAAAELDRKRYAMGRKWSKITSDENVWWKEGNADARPACRHE
jgi:hypothetical protein